MPPKVAVITCDVIRDEILSLSADLNNVIHVTFMQQGLHNDPPLLRDHLQSMIDRVEADIPNAEAIVLGYGLCSRGVEGVTTRRCKFVMARAHDCITLLLGNKEKFAEYVRDNPGTYWYSPGWNRCHLPPGPERYEHLKKEYTENYGPDDAEYLMESEQAWFNIYNRAAFVDLGVTSAEKDIDYTRRCADWLGWSFDRQRGDAALLRDLMAGKWDPQRFLVLLPGQTPRMTADEQIVTIGIPSRQKGSN